MYLANEQTLEKAAALYADGNTRDAETLYRTLLKIDPRQSEANHELGTSRLADENEAEALRLDQADANHNLGVLRIAEGRADVALPLFMKAIKDSPSSERFWLSYIACLIEQKDFDNASQTLQDVRHAGLESDDLNVLGLQLKQAVTDENVLISGASTSGETTQNAQEDKKIDVYQWKITRGRPKQAQLDTLTHLYTTGELDEAQSLGMAMVKDYPEHPFAWKVLGVLLLQSGNVTEGLVYLQKAAALAPESAEDHFNLGNALSLLGKSDEARGCFERAVILNPDFAEAYFNLGNTLRELGDLNGAETSFLQAVGCRPDYADAHFNLAKLLADLGRVTGSEQSYREAVASRSDFAEAHYNLANLLRKAGRLSDARASYLEAIAKKSDFAEAHRNLGVTLHELGRFEDAVVSLHKAIELQPDDAEAHSTLGTILSELCRHLEAEKSHLRAIELNPNAAEAHCNFGVTLQALDKLNEAEKAFTLALQLNPDFTDALLNRAGLRYELGRVDDALLDFDSCNTDDARARALELLYATGRNDEIFLRLDQRLPSDDSNIRMAAFSAFISHKLKKPIANRFCEAPLDFFYTSNLESSIANSNIFIADLIEEVKSLEADWEPAKRSTIGGFQLPNHLNIFDQKSAKIAELETVICSELGRYHSMFGDQPCSLIDRWPTEKKLHGWHVILKRQGCQAAHIHPSGWVSGVVYLQVAPDLGKNEGALELSYDGELYSDANSPRISYVPAAGDIVLFPSSLHHRTLPFTTDTERVVIAFDLLPSPSALNRESGTWS